MSPVEFCQTQRFRPSPITPSSDNLPLGIGHIVRDWVHFSGHVDVLTCRIGFLRKKLVTAGFGLAYSTSFAALWQL
jgi:hypothetical protein